MPKKTNSAEEVSKALKKVTLQPEQLPSLERRIERRMERRTQPLLPMVGYAWDVPQVPEDTSITKKLKELVSHLGMFAIRFLPTTLVLTSYVESLLGIDESTDEVLSVLVLTGALTIFCSALFLQEDREAARTGVDGNVVRKEPADEIASSPILFTFIIPAFRILYTALGALIANKFNDDEMLPPLGVAGAFLFFGSMLATQGNDKVATTNEISLDQDTQQIRNN